MTTDLLKKFLEKCGVLDYSQLTEVEKKTYKQWEEILSKEVRMEDVGNFIDKNIKRLNVELKEAVQKGEDRKALFISAKLDNYGALILLIKEPIERRKSLERDLLSRL